MLSGGTDAVAIGALAVAGAAFVLAVVTGALWPGRRPTMVIVALACIALAVGGVALIVGPGVRVRAGDVLGFALLDLRFDGLSGLLLLALGVVGSASSIFGIGYHDAGRSRMDVVAYTSFIASLALVFGSASAFSFLFAWELMALTSAALVIGPSPARTVARSGYVYLAMTHVATAAIAVAFAILTAASGSTDFEAWGPAAATFDASTRDLVFVLVLVGFGTKAGMMPLHIWLPRAHPVAPSHVSALMSGVMIKAGIFGIVRIGIEVLGPGPAWWGLLVLVAGSASAVLGVLYALAEHDLKRLLAFSSIENVGIILVGLGVALLGGSVGAQPLVIGGLTAALFHVLNHAVFKSLLFLGAGAVQGATHTRDLDRLGGLARALPFTALAFGIGAAAISGLPPLNGFASEWLTFQVLLGAGGDSALEAPLRFACYTAIGALALTAALAVATFVKATGMTFLALPRSDAAAAARETGRSMRAAQALLAGACVAIGIGATGAGSVVAGVARSIGRAPTSPPIGLDAAPPPSLGTYAPLLLTVALACVGVAVAAVVRYRAAPARRSPTWTCGVAPEPAFQYTSASFSKPARLFFEPVLRPDRELHVQVHAGTPFPRRIEYRSEVDHLIESRVYGPLHRAGIAFSQWARRVQHGTLQLYLAYTVGALVILLLAFR